MRSPGGEPASTPVEDLIASTSEEPRFLGPEQIDQLAGMVMSLGMELAVTRLRLALQEARLEAMGAPRIDEDTQRRVEAEAAAETEALVQTLISNLLPEQSHARPLVEQRFRPERST